MLFEYTYSTTISQYNKEEVSFFAGATEFSLLPPDAHAFKITSIGWFLDSYYSPNGGVLYGALVDDDLEERPGFTTSDLPTPLLFLDLFPSGDDPHAYCINDSGSLDCELFDIYQGPGDEFGPFINELSSFGVSGEYFVQGQAEGDLSGTVMNFAVRAEGELVHTAVSEPATAALLSISMGIALLAMKLKSKLS